MTAIANAAVFLNAHHVPSIGPELGMHLVRVATETQVALIWMAKGPTRDAVQRYLDGLNAVIEFACYHQVAVLASLKDLMAREGIG